MFKKIKEKLNYLEQGKFCEECGVFTNKYKSIQVGEFNRFNKYGNYHHRTYYKYYCPKCSPNYDTEIITYYKDEVEEKYYKYNVKVDKNGKII
jgi:uncharacterized Zn finger protein